MALKRKMWILLNRLRFKLIGVHFGSSMRVCDSVYIKLKGNNRVTFGNNFTLSSAGGYNALARNIRASIELEKDAIIEIGDNVGLSSPCLWIYDYLKIGNNVKIGGDVIILDSDAHSIDFEQRRHGDTDRPNAKKAGIIIGNDVLIGTRSIIMKGVTIGDRTVIGCGSVVVKSIPSDCIAAGNPCKIIKRIGNECDSSTAHLL